MIRLALVFLLAFSSAAFAQQDYPREVTVNWLNADSYVDGTLIETGDLEMVRIEIYRQNDIVPVFTATIPANGEGLAQTEIFVGAIPQPGTYRVEGYSIVIGGIESDVSVPAFKKYVGKPRSITNITLE